MKLWLLFFRALLSWQPGSSSRFLIAISITLASLITPAVSRGQDADKFEGKEYLNGRNEWFQQIHGNRDGQRFDYLSKNWEEFKKVAPFLPKPISNDPRERTINSSWQSLGPTQYENHSGWNGGIGRVSCIAFHPSNPNVLFVGTASGGIWKTKDRGVSWECLTASTPVTSVSGIVVDSTDPDIIYALTGDGDASSVSSDSNISPQSPFSTGVIKTVDGGKNWSYTKLAFGLFSFTSGYKIIMSPANHRILFVIAGSSIFRTVTAGDKWDVVQNASETFFDIKFNPGHPHFVYAVTAHDFYCSQNSGISWSKPYSVSPFSAVSVRLAIAVSRSSPNDIFVCSGGDETTGFIGLYKTKDHGKHFRWLSSSPDVFSLDSTGARDMSSQANYAMVLASELLHDDTLYIGGGNIWRSLDSGKTWKNKTFWKQGTPSAIYIHPDQHALEINPLDGRMYAGNDGGIYCSTDKGNTWTDISAGLGISQIYGVSGLAEFAPGAFGYFTGTQDNGCNLLDPAQQKAIHLLGGDAIGVAYHNSHLFSVAPQGQPIFRFDGDPLSGTDPSINPGTSGWASYAPTGDTGNSVTPLLPHPTDDRIFVGYSNLYDGVGTDSLNMLPNSLDVLQYTSLAMSPADTGHLLAATVSTLYSYDLADSAHVNSVIYSNPDPAFSPITSICASADTFTKGHRIYIGHGGYIGQHVTMTTDAGINWSDYSQGLPDVPVYCIRYLTGDSLHTVFAGTELGVYYRDSTMAGWAYYNSGLPFVPVTDLQIDTQNKSIVAATYGRGAWISPIDACLSAPKTPSIYSEGGNVICSGETFALHANSPCATGYLWNTGAMTESIQVSAPGEYSVVASNSFGSAPPATIKICGLNDICVSPPVKLGSTGFDLPAAMAAGRTGNYFCVGRVSSGSRDVTNYHGGVSDFWIVNVDAKFKVIWQRALGGSGGDIPTDIIATPDSGCLAVGWTTSKDGDIADATDKIYGKYWLVKLSKTGDLQWETSYGNPPVLQQFLYSVTAAGNNYIAAGISSIPNFASKDACILKINSAGQPVDYICLDHVFQQITTRQARVIRGLPDGSFAVLVFENRAPSGSCDNAQVRLYKYDQSMQEVWEHCIQLDQDLQTPMALDLLVTADTGFAVLAQSQRGSGACGTTDNLKLVKLDSIGTEQWTVCIPSVQNSRAKLLTDNDGGIIALHMDNNCPGQQTIDKYDLSGAKQWGTCLDASMVNAGTYALLEDIVVDMDGRIAAIATVPQDAPDGTGAYQPDFGLLTVSPGCALPYSGMDVLNLTSTTARLKWNKRLCATGYNVQFRELGKTAWTSRPVNTNTGFRNIAGLKPNTQYEWHVQSKCSSNTISMFSPLDTFLTPASPRSFEAAADPTVSIYPNPTDGDFTLKVESAYRGHLDYSVSDLLGHTLKSGFADKVDDTIEIQINLGEAVPGTYIIRVRRKDTVISLRITKL